MTIKPTPNPVSLQPQPLPLPLQSQSQSPSPNSKTKSMPPQLPPPKAAKPTQHPFDPYNSSSTGHQRAGNKLSGSVSWRQSRSLKLCAQFSSGRGGGARVADTVGAGSENFGGDGRLGDGGWRGGLRGRGRGQLSLEEAFGGVGVGVGVVKVGVAALGGKGKEMGRDGDEVEVEVEVKEDGFGQEEKDSQKEEAQKEPQIFKGLCVYINGSTGPTISDHRLKHLLVTHGANLSISLGRRTVTHVILGRPNDSQKGAGGGLAASKMQKEIQRVGGKNVEFVTVEWVLESLKMGKRASEQRFEAVRLAQKGMGRVGDMFAKAAAKKG